METNYYDFIIKYAKKLTSSTKHHVSYPTKNVLDTMYCIHWMSLGSFHNNLKPTKNKDINDKIALYYRESLHKVLDSFAILGYELEKHRDDILEEYGTKFLTESNTSNIKRYLSKYFDNVDNVMKAVKNLRNTFKRFCFPTIKDLCAYWGTYPRKYIAWNKEIIRGTLLNEI